MSLDHFYFLDMFLNMGVPVLRITWQMPVTIQARHTINMKIKLKHSSDCFDFMGTIKKTFGP